MRRLAILARLFPYPSSGASVPGLVGVAADPLAPLRADLAASLEVRRMLRRPPPVTKRFERARPMVEQLRRELAADNTEARTA